MVVLHAHKIVYQEMVLHEVLLYNWLTGSISSFYVFINMFSRRDCARNASIQSSGRFHFTMLRAHETVSPDKVVHEMLVYKRPGGFLLTVLCVHNLVSQDAVVHEMLVYKHLGRFDGHRTVFTSQTGE